MELIYHSKNTQQGNVSPFHNKISSVFDSSSDIKIMCPYLDLQYLLPFIKKMNSYKILTDISELLSSNPSNIEALSGFIDNKSIKHIKNLHAKVLLSSNQAILGSANFTKNGLTKNLELSILVDDLSLVNEMNSWFDYNWDKGILINFDDAMKFSSKFVNTTKKTEIPISWQNSFIKSSLYITDRAKSKVGLADNYLNSFDLPSKVVEKTKYLIATISKFLSDNNIPISLDNTKNYLRFSSDYRYKRCTNPITFIPKIRKRGVFVYFRVLEHSEFIDENLGSDKLDKILETALSLVKEWKYFK